MNLNDVFPDGLTGEGIFYALNEYNVPWKTSISSLSLDLEYYGNVSGGKTISPLLRRLLVNGVITESVAQKLANSLYSMNGLRWGKLWDTYNLEYNPIQNYNMTEVMSDDDTVTTYGRTHSKTGTEVDDRTRTDDNKESVYGFNSSNASDSEESDHTINDDNTHTYNVSDTDTGSDRQSHSYELTRSGNIGVTTSQQMIESERVLWMWKYFYDVVFPDVDRMLTISVYSDDVIPVSVSGGITPTGEISITLNGDYDVTEYASAAVNVPNTYTESDNGMVVYNGELVSQIGREISENGTYDTTLNNAVMVDVSNTYTAADEGMVVHNGALVAQSSQNITENGVYDTTLINDIDVQIASNFDLLSDFNASWNYSGDAWGFVADDVCAITTASSGTGTLCTTTVIDFSNYTKLKLKVDKLVGSYAPYVAQCRLAVSTSPINNSNRGSDYVNLSDGAGEYELTLPSNKSALYVGIMAWTTSQVLFTKVTAE